MAQLSQFGEANDLPEAGTGMERGTGRSSCLATSFLIEMRDDLGGLSSPPLKAGPGRRPRRRSNDERRDEKKRQHAPGRP